MATPTNTTSSNHPVATQGAADAAPSAAGVQCARPCTLVIFGAGGDLTKRLLMPSVYNLACSKLLPDDFSIVGVDIVKQDDDAWRTTLSLRRTCQQFLSKSVYCQHFPSKSTEMAHDHRASRFSSSLGTATRRIGIVGRPRVPTRKAEWLSTSAFCDQTFQLAALSPFPRLP